MVKMTTKEVRILTSFFKSGYSVKIGIDNSISLVGDKVNKFEFQIFPVEASDQIKQKAKEKGIDSISKGIRQNAANSWALGWVSSSTDKLKPTAAKPKNRKPRMSK